jgi:hypothetical protein
MTLPVCAAVLSEGCFMEGATCPQAKVQLVGLLKVYGSNLSESFVAAGIIPAPLHNGNQVEGVV